MMRERVIRRHEQIASNFSWATIGNAVRSFQQGFETAGGDPDKAPSDRQALNVLMSGACRHLSMVADDDKRKFDLSTAAAAGARYALGDGRERWLYVTQGMYPQVASIVGCGEALVVNTPAAAEIWGVSASTAQRRMRYELPSAEIGREYFARLEDVVSY